MKRKRQVNQVVEALLKRLETFNLKEVTVQLHLPTSNDLEQDKLKHVLKEFLYP